MRVQKVGYQQPRIYRQKTTGATVSPSFQKLTLDEKSFQKVFPKFWADEYAVRELKDALSGLAQDHDIELTALEVVESKHPEAIGSWVCAKVKSLCTEDKISDETRFATETQPRELDGKTFQDSITVNHIVSFVAELRSRLENY